MTCRWAAHRTAASCCSVTATGGQPLPLVPEQEPHVPVTGATAALGVRWPPRCPTSSTCAKSAVSLGKRSCQGAGRSSRPAFHDSLGSSCPPACLPSVAGGSPPPWAALLRPCTASPPPSPCQPSCRRVLPHPVPAVPHGPRLAPRSCLVPVQPSPALRPRLWGSRPTVEPPGPELSVCIPPACACTPGGQPAALCSLTWGSAVSKLQPAGELLPGPFRLSDAPRARSPAPSLDSPGSNQGNSTQALPESQAPSPLEWVLSMTVTMCPGSAPASSLLPQQKEATPPRGRLAGRAGSGPAPWGPLGSDAPSGPCCWRGRTP